MTETCLGEMFHVLADVHRRRLLIALLEHNPQNARELRIPKDTHPGENELKQLTTEMHHTHLPKLDGTGFIEWDRDSKAISKGPRFEEIRPLLELLDTHADELPADLI